MLRRNSRTAVYEIVIDRFAPIKIEITISASKLARVVIYDFLTPAMAGYDNSINFRCPCSNIDYAYVGKTAIGTLENGILLLKAQKSEPSAGSIRLGYAKLTA